MRSFSAKMGKHSNTKDNEVICYLNKTSLREPAALQKLREETNKHVKRFMIVDPLESQFLRFLVKVAGAKRCIEIGTFTGYNACSVSLALPDDGEVVALDINEEFVNYGKPFWPEDCAKKINLKLGPAVDTLDQMIKDGEAGKFDFVFIDADKPNYDNYYERALVLLKQGGIVAVDNALWNDKVIGDPSGFDAETLAIHNLNVKLKEDERVDVSFLQAGDGTYLCCKK